MKRSTPLSPRQGLRAARATWVALAAALALALLATPHSALAAPGDVVRGTVTSELALYEAPQEGAPQVGTLPVGTTLQVAELEGGWYGARFDLDGDGVSTPLYFPGLEDMAVYTAPDSSVSRGAVVGGDLSVLLAPAPDAPAVRSFSWGATIQFCMFDDDYYMARSQGVIVYIPADRVSLYAPTESGTLTRYAGASGARVFAAPDEASALLATYEAGKLLYFADFNDGWLMASMQVEGAARTVFVPKADVGLEPPPAPAPEPEQPASDVWVITSQRASSYAEASTDAAVVSTYAKGTVFPAKTAGEGWYLVVEGGVAQYLPSASVKAIDPSSYAVYPQAYGLTLSQLVSLQYDDGGTGSLTHIVSRGGSWQTATLDDVRTYVDPANFPEGTQGFFQFLDLSSPAGVSVSELNDQLAGMGVLEGQGQAFHDAAYAYGVNEAYLISHALHETGKGTSQLASGLWYDPATQTAYGEQRPGTTLVYNMYGLGAYDSNPINGVSKLAYEQGWTSVYDAVVGGAKVISRWYVASGPDTLSGQDTLYKMLWHPEYADRYGTRPWHQYATDVAWAYAQTYYLTQLYADYDNYTLTFEVPSYAGN